MTTAAERLVLLAGTGGTAAALLLAIGTGGNAGAALVDYSGLSSGTAAVHLMHDAVPPVVEPGFGGAPVALRRRPVEDIEALLLSGLI